MTRQEKSSRYQAVLGLLASHGFDGMARAIEVLLNEAVRLEREEVLGATCHERTPDRRGYANGFKAKTVQSRLGELDLPVPQVRGVVDGERCQPRALERGERSEWALKLALAEMYVQGVSTRKVAAITKELCGLDISSTRVSRAAAQLDEELEAWRRRPLERMDSLVLDARYEKVRQGGQVLPAAVLVAMGIDGDGRRSVLGVSVALSEAEVHWRSFLSSLRERGLHGMKKMTSDDHEGLKAAFVATFPGVAWQRCQVHLQRNAARCVPRLEMRKTVARELRDVFHAPSRDDAERLLEQLVAKYRDGAPRLAAWMADNVPEGFTNDALPAVHRRRLRSTNLIERHNKEILWRTRAATLFPNEASLLRLVSAVPVEITEDWETGRRYLPKEID